MGRNNYFSHDSNARNSEKLIRVRMRHKAAGYGVYFMILERLRDEPDYMSVVDYNLIAYDLREDAALIKSVVEDFGLFVFTEDGKYFYSEGFSHRMSIKDEISTVRSAAGKKGATRRWEKPEKGKTCKENGKVIANAITNDAKVITNDKNFDSKESKVKERKEKEISFSKEEKIEKEEIREDCVLPASVVRTLGECYEEMANDESWCELFRMEKGRRGLYLDQQELLMEMQDFFGELKCRGEPARTVKDAKAHFSNWINQKIEKRKQNERIQRNAYASKQEANEYAIRSLAEDYQRLHEGVDSTVPKPF